MKQKYNIEEIKKLRLYGLTLKEIGNYYGVKGKDTISKYLKRKYNIVFWKLPKKCKYCKKVFTPTNPNHKYCSIECYNNQRRIDINRNNRNYKRKKGIYIDPYLDNYLDRNNPTIGYKNAINFLKSKKSACICPLCGNSDENEFEICRGEIVCKKCQLVQE